jgi:hypothetical protein
MKSFTALTNLVNSLSLNTNATNTSIIQILINDSHRYLIQKYFDNEKTSYITTIGPQTLSLSATPSVGATSATLSTAWPYNTCSQLVVFGDGEQRTAIFSQNSSSITWNPALAGEQFATTNVIPSGATSATLSTPWPTASQTSTTSFSDGTTKTVTFTQNSATIFWAGGLAEQVAAYVNVIPTNTSLSCVGVQSYPLGAQVSKIKNATITIGQLVYSPYPVQSIQEWTKLNALPYNSSIPAYFFVYDNHLQFWPIPAQTGAVITVYCQINVADMTYADVTGTLASNGISVGSTSVTATGSSFSVYPQNVDLSYANLFISFAPPGGDGLYYQVQQFTSNTQATLLKPIVNAPNPSGASFTIGQYPFLHGDFHDIIAYWVLKIYFTSIVDNQTKAQEFGQTMGEKLELMKAYLSTKQVNVDLSMGPQPRNPNLFPNATSSSV